MQRLVLLLAAFVGILLTAAPHAARAQQPAEAATPAAAAEPPAARAAPPPPRVTRLEPAEVTRGSTVTVFGESLPARAQDIRVQLGALHLGEPVYVSPDGKSFAFEVPAVVPQAGKLARVPLGAQSVVVSTALASGSNAPRLRHGPFPLRVSPDNPAALQLSKALPLSVDLDTERLVLIGEGLGGAGEDYTLLRDGQEIPLCWSEGCKGQRARVVSPYQLEVFGPFDSTWEGKRTINVRLGDRIAPSGVEVRFVSHRLSKIHGTALAVSLALLALMVALVAFGGGKHRVGSATFALRAFLIDTETDTYSLSKLQFYLWSAAALFGYCYLTLSRALAQGHLQLGEMPENLPGILALSAGTAVVSIGITQVRGPKGSGAVHPSFGDLINVGGVVSPERFQFLLWTLVAIGGFLFNLLRSDPSSISELPKVPESLLALSGVSAAAYLGGKLARSPGPVVDEVLVGAGSLVFTVLGRNLSIDASFEIDGESVTQYMKDKTLRLEVIEREKDEGGSTFAKKLRLTLDDFPPEWLEAEERQFTFTLINRDGQKSAATFVLDEALRTALATPSPAAEPVVALP